MNQQDILNKVKSGEIHWCCIKCANIFKVEQVTDSIYTCHEGKCEICDKQTVVSTAKKLFGYYKSY